MSRHPFGWDLPPGVRVSDMPRNRPEDEAIEDGFYQESRFTPEQWKFLESKHRLAQQHLCDVLRKAIDYGIDIGQKQADVCNQENRFYESRYHQEIRNPKLRAYFKTQRQTSKEMYEALLSALGSLVALDIKNHSWGQEILNNIQRTLAKFKGKS